MDGVFPWVWAVLLALILIFEGIALGKGKTKWTLSYQVWFLRAKFYGRFVLIPLWAWLTWHFWLEPPSWGPGAGLWIDDYIVIGLGIIAAMLVDFGDPLKPPEVEGYIDKQDSN